MERFSLTDIQARAIVEMRLRQLTGLEQDKLRAEFEELQKLIEYLKKVLHNERITPDEDNKDEAQLEVKEKYGDKRRTEIIKAAGEFNPEDFYADDEMVITISHMGYIKRTPSTEFRTRTGEEQGRMEGSTP